jgi:hypothetical protein
MRSSRLRLLALPKSSGNGPRALDAGSAVRISGAATLRSSGAGKKFHSERRSDRLRLEPLTPDA